MFINPAELFVQPPMPTAPRSRYTNPLSLSEPSSVPEPVPTTSSIAPLPPVDAVSPPSQPTNPQNVPSTSPKMDIQFSNQAQSNFQPQHQQPPPPPAISAEPAKAHLTPKIELKHPPSTPNKTISVKPQPTPSPSVNAVPQVMIPAPSPEVMKMQKQPKKQPQKRQSNQHVEKPAKPSKPPVDYQVLLLSLADEYLNAAHQHGTMTALTARQGDVEEYYKLIATGLGCLEAVLKVSLTQNTLWRFVSDRHQNWRLQPRKEALVRLRYARTLFEETDNDLEAETALSKGVSFSRVRCLSIEC